MSKKLLSIVPQPVHAVVLLFPIRGEIETAIEAEEATFTTQGRPEVDPTVLWIKQTVSSYPTNPILCTEQRPTCV